MNLYSESPSHLNIYGREPSDEQVALYPILVTVRTIWTGSTERRADAKAPPLSDDDRGEMIRMAWTLLIRDHLTRSITVAVRYCSRKPVSHSPEFRLPVRQSLARRSDRLDSDRRRPRPGPFRFRSWTPPA